MKLSDTAMTVLNRAAQNDDRFVYHRRELAPANELKCVWSLEAKKLLELTDAPFGVEGLVTTTVDDFAKAFRITKLGLAEIGVVEDESEAAQEAPKAAKGGRKSRVAATTAPEDATAPQGAQDAPSAMPIAAGGKRFASLEAAKTGILPPPPDFTAETHKPHRAKLARLIELAQARDIAGLRAVAINPTSTSPKAMMKFRDLAIMALEARGA